MPAQQPVQDQSIENVLPQANVEELIPSLSQSSIGASEPSIATQNQSESLKIIQSEQMLTSSTPKPSVRISRLAIILVILFLALGVIAYVVYRIILTLPPKYKDVTTTTYQQASVKIVKSWQKSENLGIATLKDVPKIQTTQNAINAYQYITYVPSVVSSSDINTTKRLELTNLLNKKQDSFLHSAVFKEFCKEVKDLVYEYQAPLNDSEFIRSHFHYNCRQSAIDENPGRVSGVVVISKKGDAVSTAIVSSEKIWKANDRTFNDIIDSLVFAVSSKT